MDAYLNAPSFFPLGELKGLPQFSTLLASGCYHPSAPIHLALSLKKIQSCRPIILHPSREDFKDDLNRFNDMHLSFQSGHGTITALSSDIEIFYPPSPVHLHMFLSVLGACDPRNLPQNVPQSIQVTCRKPDVIILVEPSKYFATSTSDLDVELTLSSYMNLIHRVLACRSVFDSSPQAPKFILFDSRLYDLEVPITSHSVNVPEGYGLHQVHHVDALPLVEKYFDLVGIFEDDPSYVQSSQDSEVEADDGVPKQLRLYYVGQKPDECIRYKWSEIVDGTKGTGFRWL